MASRFDGRTALITGAAHGIGLATAKAFEREGARVIGVDVAGDELSAAFADLRGVTEIVADVSRSPGALAAEAIRLAGTPDILVNNVGINSGKSFLELTEPELDRTYATNVHGPWFLTKAFAERWIASGLPGTIVFILSLHDERVIFNPDYSATKAALRMLVKELAVELAPHRIRVNGVSPGAIDTWSDRAGHDPDAPSPFDGAIPAGRLGEPDDVARMVLALCDEATSGYVTGAIVPVDGGLGLHTWLPNPFGDAAGRS